MGKDKYTDKRTPTRKLEPLEILTANVDLFTARRGQRKRTTMLGFEDQREYPDYQANLARLLNLPGTRNAVLSTIDQSEAARRGYIKGWFRVKLG